MGPMNARKSIAALLSALALASLVGVHAPLIVADAKADEGEIKPIATTGETNLRKAPGTESVILTLIPKGTRVEVGDCRNGWCRVSWNGQDGYAIARNLDTAAAPRWPRAPVAAWQDYDHGPWQKVSKLDIAGAHEERDADHGLILEIGTAGEWPFNGDRPNFGGTIAVSLNPSKIGWSWNLASRRWQQLAIRRYRATFCSRSRFAFLPRSNSWLAGVHPFRKPSTAQNGELQRVRNSRSIGCSGQPKT
jgi:uncharacterized protein YraI